LESGRQEVTSWGPQHWLSFSQNAKVGQHTPAAQVLPQQASPAAQPGWPFVQQALHVPPQHGCPAGQLSAVPLVQQRSLAMHVPPQHFWPGPQPGLPLVQQVSLAMHAPPQHFVAHDVPACPSVWLV
jgi:hypothetical protein